MLEKCLLLLCLHSWRFCCASSKRIVFIPFSSRLRHLLTLTSAAPIQQNCQLCNLAPRVLSNWMTNKCSNCLVYVKKVPCFSFFFKALTPPDSVIFTHEWKKGGKFDLFTDNVVLEATNHSPLYHRTLCISLGHRAGDTRQQPSVSHHVTNALAYHSKGSGRK